MLFHGTDVGNSGGKGKTVSCATPRRPSAENIPECCFAPAGPAQEVADHVGVSEATEPPEPAVLGPQRKVRVVEYD
eukprot:3605089-Pyramimonas_sp.AAC.2